MQEVFNPFALSFERLIQLEQLIGAQFRVRCAMCALGETV